MLKSLINKHGTDETKTAHLLGTLEDLHKPFIDFVEFNCTDTSCTGTMKRVPEVIDVWFDSGAMPYAQWGTVFHGEKEIESFAADAHRFPAEFISEAIDQTRGWFYSLLAISTMLTGKVPFKNVIVSEFILDKEGKKMSKHKGNVVDPFATIEKYGADPVRWYLIATSSPSTPTKFDEAALGEVVRKHFDTLRNTYSFFALYANTDEVASRAKADNLSVADWLEKKAGPRTIFDRWIESKLNSLVADVTRQLDAYDITRPVRAIQNFVIEELSNWYVRLNRRRFWGSGDDPDKFRAYATLHYCLETVCRLSAPVAPITSELFWRELQGCVNGNDATIHATQFPKSDAAKIEKELESVMSQIQTAVSLGRAARTRKNLKIRQPLGRMMISASTKHPLFNELLPVVAEELNIKDVTLAAWEEIEALISYSAKLNFKSAGPRLGNAVKAVGVEVTKIQSSELARFAKSGKTTLALNGDSFDLTRDDIELIMTEKDGYAVATEGTLGVAIATAITDALRAEGFARETINKIQTMRKAAGFEVTDQIEIKLDVGETLRHALTAHEGFIKKETLATAMTFASLPKPEKTETGNPAAWDVNGESAVIQVTRVNS
jgi:isoleucyl-tRNA synthetase